MATTICDICEIEIIKYNLIKHQKSETCNKIKFLLNKQKEKYELIINEKNMLLKNVENINKELKENITNLTEVNINMKNEIKMFEKSTDEYRKIVEKAATKSTKIINKNNYNHNNYLNYISSEPLTISDMQKQLKRIVNCDTVMYNDDDFHNHIVDNIFKDKNGNDKVLCTDINRKNFTYKDETSGELISDPELERLREQFKKGSDIREIRRELLEKLVIEYEDNGSIGIDPYKRFSEIIQKLNFGTPFVDHVAKKTYVKRCPSVKSENILEKKDINKIGFEMDKIKEIENIDYSVLGDPSEEEEYKKLLEEFGNECN